MTTTTKKKWTAKNVTVNRAKDVKQITIPDGMTLKEAAAWLERKDAEEDKEVEIHEEIECFPLDGAVALIDALDEIYGFVAKIDTPGFWGDQHPPVMVAVPVSATEKRRIPWGRLQIPGIAGYVQTGLRVTRSGPRFVLEGETKQRHMHEIQALVEKIHQRLRDHSIYKGKAVKLDLSWTNDPRHFDPSSCAPQFSIPVDQVREEELIFPEDVQKDIQQGLFTHLECSRFVRSHQVPMKRGVLLAGGYGTGKTMTAYVAAKKAVENGYTFIYLSNVCDLAAAFQFARQYAPAVVFAEDIDRAVGHDRNVSVDAILNSFDGVDSKDAEIITVLTTNHVENISQALIRPGRCDLVVKLTRPDQDAAGRLVQLYGRGLLAEDIDLDRVGHALQNHLPAEIREVVERSKLAAIRRLYEEGHLKEESDTIQGHVREQDLLDAVHSMKVQHDLLQPKPLDNRSPLEKAAEQLAFCLGSSIEGRDERNAYAAVRLLQRIGLKAEAIYDGAGELIPDQDGQQN